MREGETVNRGTQESPLCAVTLEHVCEIARLLLAENAIQCDACAGRRQRDARFTGTAGRSTSRLLVNRKQSCVGQYRFYLLRPNARACLRNKVALGSKFAKRRRRSKPRKYCRFAIPNLQVYVVRDSRLGALEELFAVRRGNIEWMTPDDFISAN